MDDKPTLSKPDAALSEQVYTHLRAIAGELMKGERGGHTLQATALVNEAYIRMHGPGAPRYQSRGAFFHAAAEAMRRVLIDHARARGAEKRGGGLRRLPADVLDLAADPTPEEILSFDGAISRLEAEHELAAAVVRLRFFAGLGVSATASALGVSDRTVNREWVFARAWLYRELDAARKAGGGA